MLNKKTSFILFAVILFLGSAITLTSCSESKKEEKTDTMMSVDSSKIKEDAQRILDSIKMKDSMVLDTRPVKTP